VPNHGVLFALESKSKSRSAASTNFLAVKVLIFIVLVVSLLLCLFCSGLQLTRPQAHSTDAETLCAFYQQEIPAGRLSGCKPVPPASPPNHTSGFLVAKSRGCAANPNTT
jgi:hypothetical protein